jgi:hypothetical protein
MEVKQQTVTDRTASEPDYSAASRERVRSSLELDASATLPTTFDRVEMQRILNLPAAPRGAYVLDRLAEDGKLDMGDVEDWFRRADRVGGQTPDGAVNEVEEDALYREYVSDYLRDVFDRQANAIGLDQETRTALVALIESGRLGISEGDQYSSSNLLNQADTDPATRQWRENFAAKQIDQIMEAENVPAQVRVIALRELLRQTREHGDMPDVRVGENGTIELASNRVSEITLSEYEAQMERYRQRQGDSFNLQRKPEVTARIQALSSEIDVKYFSNSVELTTIRADGSLSSETSTPPHAFPLRYTGSGTIRGDIPVEILPDGRVNFPSGVPTSVGEFESRVRSFAESREFASFVSQRDWPKLFSPGNEQALVDSYLEFQREFAAATGLQIPAGFELGHRIVGEAEAVGGAYDPISPTSGQMLINPASFRERYESALEVGHSPQEAAKTALFEFLATAAEERLELDASLAEQKTYYSDSPFSNFSSPLFTEGLLMNQMFGTMMLSPSVAEVGLGADRLAYQRSGDEPVVRYVLQSLEK